MSDFVGAAAAARSQRQSSPARPNDAAQRVEDPVLSVSVGKLKINLTRPRMKFISIPCRDQPTTATLQVLKKFRNLFWNSPINEKCITRPKPVQAVGNGLVTRDALLIYLRKKISIYIWLCLLLERSNSGGRAAAPSGSNYRGVKSLKNYFCVSRVCGTLIVYIVN